MLLFCRFLGQYGDTEVTLNVSKYSCGGENTIQYLEHVVVVIQARFDRRGYLEGNLTSPRGTTSQILPYRANDVIATDFNNWPMLSLQFWGENPEGAWNLRFRNHFPAHEFSGKRALLIPLHNCRKHRNKCLTAASTSRCCGEWSLIPNLGITTPLPPHLYESCTEAEGYDSFFHVNYTSWISC